MNLTSFTARNSLKFTLFALLAAGTTLSSIWAVTTSNNVPPPTVIGTPTPTPTPVPTPTPFPAIPNTVVPIGKSMTINLGKYFPSPLVPTNAINSIPSNSVYVNTSEGDFYIQLYPTNAPVTVANFLRYVTNGLYNGMVIHRSVTNFIIQSGGYDINPALSYTTIPSFGTITNEFGISNTRGTVAMALVGTNPDSATSQWFINLADNSSILDDTNTSGNPPFAVFGQVIGTNGMAPADAIAALPLGNYSSPFDTLPLNHWGSNSVNLAYTNLVIVTNMVATFPSAVCPDNKSFSISLQGTNLIITPHSLSTSPATVYVNTVDTNGVPFTKTFQISTRKFFQTINFSTINYTVYSTNPYSLATYPTVNSGTSVAASFLPVSITVASGAAIMTNVVTNGATNRMIALKGAGWVQLVATQPGNALYNAAPPTTGWLEVYKASQTIAFPTIPAQTNGFAGPYALLITNYPTASSGLPVTVSVKSGPAKVIQGGHALTILGAGTVTVAATQIGNANYYSALSKTNTFVVTPAP